MKLYEGKPTQVEGRTATEIAVYRFLDTLNLCYTTICHEPAFTMEACAAVEKELGVPIAKNLFLCNRQQTEFYLLMLPGDKIFKTKYLSSQLGCARLSFADDRYMMELLGIKPGSVSPLGLMNDIGHHVRLIIDKDLMTDEFIGCHPCVNSSTLKIRMHDLLKIIIPAMGHDYTVVMLPKDIS